MIILRPPIPGHTPIQIDNDDEIPAHLLLLGDSGRRK